MPVNYIYDKISKVVDIKNKDKAAALHVNTMLNRTARMFKWTGLPRTVPERNLELMLQCFGNVFFAEVEGDLYCFNGGLGGAPDPYYEPTQYIVANPALKLSKTYDIGADGILMRNDTMMRGLLPMMNRTAFLMAENEISMYLASVNQRIVSLITVDNANAKKEADIYLDKVLKGDLGVVLGMGLTEAIHTQPYSTAGHNSITQLIEMEQYLKASLLNDLGLNANYNMKRESLSTTESQMNFDALLPLVDDMLNRRQEAVEDLNKMFGTEITVELSSAWEVLQAEADQAKDPEEMVEGGEDNGDNEESVSELEN